MKARLFTLLLLLATSYTNISAQYKNGAWGINEIPGQNTTAPMVLFNRPTLKEDTAFVKNAIRNKMPCSFFCALYFLHPQKLTYKCCRKSVN
ncbi:MAG: hypothetical protein LCH37_07505 [Bacteroidetes bacterium]|nr:hypothetical protein [Bacteroidota bacterium]MCK6609824.1 hypothetical protein [Bacteroidia bacterium]